MLESIEALIALERTGTISEAAVQLRLTQSAVSKRIQALQSELGFPLTEPFGRKVRLTQRAILLLEKAKPLVAELSNLGSLQQDADLYHFKIGMADSIAASWGPKFIRKVAKTLPELDLEIHVHRGVLVQEYVKLGRYHFGLCTALRADSALVANALAEESMVLIPSGLKPRPNEEQKLVTIERDSSTWTAIADQVLKHPKLQKYDSLYVESFSAAIQMAREGFGNALVPKGLATAVGVQAKNILSLQPAIKRQIQLISRKNVALLPITEKLIKAIRSNAREVL